MSEGRNVEPFPWRPPGPGPGPWPPGWRPPGGAWPPCPPGPGPMPPDIFSALFWLSRAYDDVRATKAFLRKLIADLLADDPNLFGQGRPIIGVTDGSDAQPGQVGEFVRMNATFPCPATSFAQVQSLGVLQPGDWDCWMWVNPVDYGTESMQIWLQPQPAGFDNEMYTGQVLAQQEWDSLVTQHSRASLSVPTLISVGMETNINGATNASNQNLAFCARRVR